jgi:hypothetical protein
MTEDADAGRGEISNGTATKLLEMGDQNGDRLVIKGKWAGNPPGYDKNEPSLKTRLTDAGTSHEEIMNSEAFKKAGERANFGTFLPDFTCGGIIPSDARFELDLATVENIAGIKINDAKAVMKVREGRSLAGKS